MVLSDRRHAVAAALFAALTAVGAFIRVPLPFVPFTLQFFFCALAGFLLPPRWAFRSQILYVALGLAGLPLFSGGGGPAYVFQPTFGYLVGFCLCAPLTSLLSRRWGARLSGAFGAALAGLAVVYLWGVSWLWAVYRFWLDDPRGLLWALTYGFLLCVGGDLLLCGLVAAVSRRLVPLLRTRALSS
ncbi:biotin transporter BioY [Aminithiophilus ramosus]|uniref:Biotin transporter n=1 Tax=Aminithiophilus ramosus TaxID=3029084 RepID=A0A9Q7EYN2_9BACT|nr:biotin transporter BioY [Aminithiophilus ramosus]QTX32201.1 biotin transporter BioY [Aminithiophilus ramosus]